MRQVFNMEFTGECGAGGGTSIEREIRRSKRYRIGDRRSEDANGRTRLSLDSIDSISVKLWEVWKQIKERNRLAGSNRQTSHRRLKKKIKNGADEKNKKIFFFYFAETLVIDYFLVIN